jgi:hypothetical protein
VTTTYDAAPHAGSGTCSNGLTPVLSYSSGSAPVNVGTHTLTVTCGGTPTYAVATATASIVITPRAASATAGSATMYIGGTVPPIGCTVTGLLAPDAGAITCTASVPSTLVAGPNTVSSLISPSAPQNYAVTPVSGVLSVTYRQVTCFDSPLAGTSLATSAGINKGASITARCGLNMAGHGIVTTAKGDLLVQDLGATGTGTPLTVLSVPNAFALGSYWYTASFSTSPAQFVAGRHYRVTALWDDGTSTVGYFHLAP